MLIKNLSNKLSRIFDSNHRDVGIFLDSFNKLIVTMKTLKSYLFKLFLFIQKILTLFFFGNFMRLYLFKEKNIIIIIFFKYIFNSIYINADNSYNVIFFTNIIVNKMLS